MMGEVPWPSIDVANTFIQRYSDKNITHLKLQKLCYYAYGWWLALRPKDKPLMADKPQVWRYGPVFHPVFAAFSGHKADPIKKLAAPNPFSSLSCIEKNDSPSSRVIDWIWERYGGYTAQELSGMTHEKGTPWREKVEKFKYRIPSFLDLEDDDLRPYFENLAKKTQAL